MKIVLVSDTHGCQPRIPEGDVLIHCGDAFCGDDIASLRSDLRQFGALPHRFKLWVLGNHDVVLIYLLKTQPKMAHSLLKSAGITLLQDSSVEIEEFHFYGVGWKSTVSIPKTDVIISHEPCYGILDAGMGSPVLRRAVLSARPRLFVSGHIHGARGHAVVKGVHFYNATLDAPTKDIVGAMSHSIESRQVEPWVHTLETK